MRLQINPPVIEIFPNDRHVFTGKWTPPFAGWRDISNNGDITSDFALNVDGAGSEVTGKSAHHLHTGIGLVEWTMDDFFRPSSSGGTGFFVFTGSAFDINGTERRFRVEVEPTQIKVRDEASTLLHTHAGAPVSGNIYKLELSGAGFRFYLNGGLVFSRLVPADIATALVYPMTYEALLIEPTISSPSRALPPKLTGDWRLGPYITWTAPSHGSISTTGPSLETEYSGGTVPGDYTLTGQIEPAADAEDVQLATATIRIPPLIPLGNLSEAILQPGEVRRFKTNYDEAKNAALVAWSVILGGGTFTQGEFTAQSLAGTSLVRAVAAVNSSAANITVTVPPVISNANDYAAAKASEQIDFDHNLPLLPSYVSAGTMAEGTGAIVPGLPPGLLKDDIMLLFVETGAEAVSTPSGWSTVADSPQIATNTRLTVFWKRVGAVPANETAPTVSDPGDHAIGQILAFRNCIATGNPWDVTSGDTGASSTSVSIPGDTTTVANCLVVLAVSNQTDSATAQTSGFTNTDLANLTERTDVNTTQGNGGGFAVATGEKASIGAYGATTATLANASEQARISIALKPAVPTWTASIGSINSSTGVWTAPSKTGQTALITVSNGTLSVTNEVDILEVFPRTDFKLPWAIDLAKVELLSEAEDGSRTSRVKSEARRSFPVELLVDAVEDLNGAGLDTIRSFWDRHGLNSPFILEDPEEDIRLVVYRDSPLRWSHTAIGIEIAFRVKEAEG